MSVKYQHGVREKEEGRIPEIADTKSSGYENNIADIIKSIEIFSDENNRQINNQN